MAMRTCEKCSRAENPLSRLRFKKSRLDGKIYCENCMPSELPDLGRVPEEASYAIDVSSSPPLRKPSAGYVVVRCPECAGQPSGSSQCAACAGYGSVRIEASMLNVYRPQPMSAPQILTED